MPAVTLPALALLAATVNAAPAAGPPDRPGAPRREPRPLAPLALPAPAPPVTAPRVEQRDRPLRSGTVSSVTARRAYLDAGTLDGLAPGQRVDLERRGRAAATCTVEAVSDRSATCVGSGVRAGDTFAIAPRAPAPATAGTAERPTPDAPVAPEELRRLRAAAEAAPVAKVEFVPPPRQESVRELRRIEVSLVHASWFSSGAGALHQERLEARVRGTELVPGWRLFLDASAVYRPVGVDEARFQPGTSAFLEVRELQAASREADRPYTIAIGRVLPWNAPGSTVFDGAQVGWRGRDGEIGVFGGIVPDVLTTTPTTSRGTAGLYGTVERGGNDSLLRGEGRVAMVRSPELGTRLEAEALAHAWLSRRVDVSGQARLGFGDRTAPAALDLARVDLTARLAEPLWATGSFRYVGLLVLDPAAPALFPNPARHTDVTISWDVARGLTLRGTGGYARDVGSGLERGYLGPEISLPRLFGRRGGVSAGWLEERGWAAGRNVWLQASGDGLWGLRLLARASLFMDRRPAPLSDETTVGVVASASRDLTSWLRFRIGASARLGLGQGEATGGPGGLSLLAALDGLH